MSVHAWLTDVTPCPTCNHPRNAHGKITRTVSTWFEGVLNKGYYWRCVRCECRRLGW